VAWEANGSQAAYDGLDQFVECAHIVLCLKEVEVMVLQDPAESERSESDHVIDVIGQMPSTFIGCIEEDPDDGCGRLHNVI
jgi:hypothetical protein